MLPFLQFSGALACCVALLSSVFAPRAFAATHAVVVAVSEYPRLGLRLDGPLNDAALITEALRSRGVLPTHTTELSLRPGADAPPTAAKIWQALRSKQLEALPGDTLIVYFSGHGAQVPQSGRTRNRYAEPDGFDEVLLPMDTTVWSQALKRVEGGILDDDLGLWVAGLRERRIDVWLIVDSCHSADVHRSAMPMTGASAPVVRSVSLSQLGAPLPGLLPATSKPVVGGQPFSTKETVSRAAKASTLGRLTVFAASQKGQSAFEEVLIDPNDPSRKKRFGVLTHALHEVMMKMPAASVEELAREVRRRYVGRPFPTPALPDVGRP